MNTRTHHKERIGQLLVFQGKETGHADEFGPGDIGAVAKLKETRAGDWLAERDEPIAMPPIALPAPVMAFAMEPKTKGDEDKVFTALRRLQEEDPTIDLHRDPQTGEQIVAGLSQIHVEVDRRAPEVALRRRGRRSSRRACPTRRRSAGQAKAHGRHKKQTGGRGQFGDCHIEIEPLEPATGFEFVNAIKGGVIPHGLHPGGREGRRRGDGRTGPSPASRSRACACGSTTAPTTPSTPSEMAFKHGRLDRDARGDGGRRRRCCSSRSCS